MDGLCVIMVSYYPKERTSKAIDALLSMKEIELVIIVDNTPTDIDYFTNYSYIKKIEVIKLKENIGIAKAQNIGINRAVELGYDWVVTSDQDTIFYEELCKKYLKYISYDYNTKGFENVGLIGTDYIDIATNRPKYNNQDIIEVVETISSGSLVNTQICKQLGGMKEKYFIDQVDNEFCYRLRKCGFRIIILPQIGMEHQIGNINQRKFLWKTICTYNQAPIRTYYRTRNSIWFAREYHDTKLRTDKIKSLMFDIVRITYEKEKAKKMFMFIKGIRDGLFQNYK